MVENNEQKNCRPKNSSINYPEIMKNVLTYPCLDKQFFFKESPHHSQAYKTIGFTKKSVSFK